MAKRAVRRVRAELPPVVLEPAQRDAVQHEWLRRVEAEYRSAAVTSSLAHWLIQLAAPIALIEAALRIVSDELAHAELSHAVYRDAGGEQAPQLVRETLGLARTTSPLEHDVLRHGVEIFCLGETIAVRLFSRMRARCDVPSARAALDRILVDEVRHRDFGWTLLEWLLSTEAAETLRHLLADELPAMLARMHQRYGGDAPASDLPTELRRYGLISRAEYAEVLAQTLERDYRAGFSELGIEMGAARV